MKPADCEADNDRALHARYVRREAGAGVDLAGFDGARSYRPCHHGAVFVGTRRVPRIDGGTGHAKTAVSLGQHRRHFDRAL